MAACTATWAALKKWETFKISRAECWEKKKNIRKKRRADEWLHLVGSALCRKPSPSRSAARGRARTEERNKDHLHKERKGHRLRDRERERERERRRRRIVAWKMSVLVNNINAHIQASDRQLSLDAKKGLRKVVAIHSVLLLVTGVEITTWGLLADHHEASSWERVKYSETRFRTALHVHGFYYTNKEAERFDYLLFGVWYGPMVSGTIFSSFFGTQCRAHHN